jgi:hypothetical protein
MPTAGPITAASRSAPNGTACHRARRAGTTAANGVITKARLIDTPMTGTASAHAATGRTRRNTALRVPRSSRVAVIALGRR